MAKLVSRKQGTATVMSFSNRLRKARDNAGLTVCELAARVGVQPTTLFRLENAELNRKPDYETLIALAQELEVSTDYLCGLEGASVPAVAHFVRSVLAAREPK
jgi:transcriptional regulator with XRE-family HTH domain